MKWVKLYGNWNENNNDIEYRSSKIQDNFGKENWAFGLSLCDEKLREGNISLKVKFNPVTDINSIPTLGIIFHYDCSTKDMLLASMDAKGFALQSFVGGKWTYLTSNGAADQIEYGKEYELNLKLKGQIVIFSINGVPVIKHRINFINNSSQVGLFCRSSDNIFVNDFMVASEAPEIFVVLEFSEQFEMLYNEVILPVCKKFKLNAVTAKEIKGPGFILNDIIQKIFESNFIIAEITSDNPNVFYEIGYAHAIGIPTILLAEKNKKLPFDISGFRVIFYENTIDGKRKVEESLINHLSAIVENVF